MTDHPSPRARRLSSPSWLDARLVLGLLLVLVSVVVGARVLSSADRSQLVWAAAGDLAVGSQLSEGDLTAVRVRLFDSGPAYLRAEGAAPAGYVLRRAVGAGELLPQDALARPGADVDVRLVTVPVEAGHYPPTLQADQRVDLWVTPRAQDAPPPDSPPQDAPAPAAPPGPAALRLEGAQQVLSQATVVTGPPAQDVPGSGGTVPVVLLVPPGDVPKVVSALGLGRLDVVRVPRQSEAQGELVAPLEAG